MEVSTPNAPRSTLHNLLTLGNDKLGEAIHAWSIPAIKTCPGRSGPCSRACYADHGYYNMPSVKNRLASNLGLTQAADFVPRMVAEIHRRGCTIVRVHVAGDFYDADYVAKWLTIASRCPRTTFYAYTRSWRIDSIMPGLARFAGLKNVKLWFSADSETGIPAKLPPRVRVAYMQTEASDQPKSDLTFRIRPLRGMNRPAPGLTVICPVEATPTNPHNITCTSCRLCFK